MDQNALQQIIDRLKEANNVLVTVTTNPSVDQLAACIGFTLLLNHLGKHGTAVFSGTVPSTIEFLKPDDTLEKNTDSLRDFIIALDKSKADKLRYKVEDKVVKIFITPYRTSINEKDLDFSQGDFNVDVVMALGVHERTDLDKAIMDHGRILHDATVISVNNKEQGNLGAINWVDLNTSSLSEMMVELARSLNGSKMDAQMATAFMTGIVAETDRFSNNKTSPRTMSIAAELMAAGANQQLIASKLQATPQAAAKPAEAPAEEPNDEVSVNEDGSLVISHPEGEDEEGKGKDKKTEAEADTDKDKEVGDVFAGLDKGSKDKPEPPEPKAGMPSRPSMALEPPTLGGRLTANSEPEHMQSEGTTDALSLPPVDNGSAAPRILTRPADMGGSPIQPSTLDSGSTTLSSIEQSVSSPHLNPSGSSDDKPDASATEEKPSDAPEPKDEASNRGEELEEAREAVSDAIAAEPTTGRALDPIQALGATPVDLNQNDNNPAPAPAAPEPFRGATTYTPLEQTLAAANMAPAAAPAAPAPVEPAPAAPIPQEHIPLAVAPVPPADSGTPDSPIMPNNPPAPAATPFGAPPNLNGVNPNLPGNPSVPPSLLPPSQPVDPTASNGNPTAPPPVPPPLAPPPGGL